MDLTDHAPEPTERPLTRAAPRSPRLTWRTWAATETEVAAVLPGDEIVGQAKYRTTRAVTIEAAAEDVWPWLAQMGQGRGGLYSYDRLENLLGLHMHSADRILPELQSPAVGDVIRLVPEGTQPPLRFVVARVEPPHLLVWGPEGSRGAAYAANLPLPLLDLPGHCDRRGQVSAGRSVPE